MPRIAAFALLYWKSVPGGFSGCSGSTTLARSLPRVTRKPRQVPNTGNSRPLDICSRSRSRMSRRESLRHSGSQVAAGWSTDSM